MEEYLTTTITKLKANNYNELTLVLGNESCDLDSAVSALVYAAFLHWQYSQIKCKACTRKYRDESYKDDIFVPILDVERNDYPIKTDVVYCLKKHGIDETNLIFRDDIDIRQLVTKSKMSVVLTDHHFLSRRYDFLSPFVSEIIDHRPVVNASFNDIRTTIQTVGSCCTLVTHRIRDLTNLLAKDGDFFGAYPVTADLLHSVILLDTANFSKEVNKATPSDEDAVLYLECLIKPADYQKERSSKVLQLLSARGDVSSLSSSQLLRKDLKILGDVLVPSLPVLVKRPDCTASVVEALKTNHCAVALLLGMDLTKELQRDGAVIGLTEDKATQLFKYLAGFSSLGLVRGGMAGGVYFTQSDLSATRKQYMTMLANYIGNK
ncbi:exopolyphosphatase PRUNE1 isoform X2 [Danaus plexippus]|uniref:exopolyphosphatase PRUNE1 isoform X2 n=1 Tax=Danaus plexippus TaxID=13037 RepID=UPI002AB1EFF6|nr:exopolyphosphatase PRUNE1 isoform X2 [Danaus plexippus]